MQFHVKLEKKKIENSIEISPYVRCFRSLVGLEFALPQLQLLSIALNAHAELTWSLCRYASMRLPICHLSMTFHMHFWFNTKFYNCFSWFLLLLVYIRQYRIQIFFWSNFFVELARFDFLPFERSLFFINFFVIIIFCWYFFSLIVFWANCRQIKHFVLNQKWNKNYTISDTFRKYLKKLNELQLD